MDEISPHTQLEKLLIEYERAGLGTVTPRILTPQDAFGISSRDGCDCTFIPLYKGMGDVYYLLPYYIKLADTRTHWRWNFWFNSPVTRLFKNYMKTKYPSEYHKTNGTIKDMKAFNPETTRFLIIPDVAEAAVCLKYFEDFFSSDVQFPDLQALDFVAGALQDATGEFISHMARTPFEEGHALASIIERITGVQI